MPVNVTPIPNSLAVSNGEIVLYQPDDNVSLEVRLEHETVWLSQAQMTELFRATKQNISLHISNIYAEGELAPKSTVKEYLTVQAEGERQVTRLVKYYNLDVIISVGYRIKSIAGTHFRQWATRVLKDYMLRGYAINQRLLAMEERIDRRLTQHEKTLNEHQEKIDFFVRSSLPPVEQVFFNGQFFDARVALENIIKTAKKRVVIIDGYIDAKTLDMLDVRQECVTADIYTKSVSEDKQRLMEEHNAQKDKQSITIHAWAQPSHDRWLIIDDTLYHCGHSLNALGNHLSAITQMGISPDEVLSHIVGK